MSNSGETILLSIKQCMLFKIIGKDGQVKKNAADWQQSDFLWSGRCLVTRSPEHCIVKFVENNDIEFCSCIVSDNSIQNVNDSSRYFILKVNEINGGRKATVGLGFVDRSNAFDFSAVLQDIERKMNKKDSTQVDSVQTDNYILNDGETISLPFDNLTAVTDTPNNLRPFDETKVPSITFNASQAQPIDIEEEKEETITVLNEVQPQTNQPPSIDFSNFGQPTQVTQQKLEINSTTNSTNTVDLFSNFNQQPVTHSQKDTINFDLFSSPSTQNKLSTQNALDILLFN
ncbi:adaptin ear-binding coat-associated protein, putative [Entamoeba dispar SAW760]|uniref:Adaptin ear-binding coat-associated protein, putative n=1 Tax=Entamoeba dispar (strain ATCC PRA-260 / SAW760) TaxID=370354 RepID=B0E9Q5_ENTDS|nr:adaptin ear-binding coat-associated protein, putative [Entamoeba dispar SAW760]EDR28773.1 adaptin ear-binding coat-associated protein, putative [Entamoeba dispar SAW760]|eukprot:EDR28773.1 adaptin ear-binding coat-associated protein, putative [Entamoeba dispar SAW760]